MPARKAGAGGPRTGVPGAPVRRGGRNSEGRPDPGSEEARPQRPGSPRRLRRGVGRGAAPGWGHWGPGRARAQAGRAAHVSRRSHSRDRHVSRRSHSRDRQPRWGPRQSMVSASQNRCLRTAEGENRRRRRATARSTPSPPRSRTRRARRARPRRRPTPPPDPASDFCPAGPSSARPRARATPSRGSGRLDNLLFVNRQGGRMMSALAPTRAAHASPPKPNALRHLRNRAQSNQWHSAGSHKNPPPSLRTLGTTIRPMPAIARGRRRNDGALSRPPRPQPQRNQSPAPSRSDKTVGTMAARR